LATIFVLDLRLCRHSLRTHRLFLLDAQYTLKYSNDVIVVVCASFEGDCKFRSCSRRGAVRQRRVNCRRTDATRCRQISQGHRKGQWFLARLIRIAEYSLKIKDIVETREETKKLS